MNGNKAKLKFNPNNFEVVEAGFRFATWEFDHMGEILRRIRISGQQITILASRGQKLRKAYLRKLKKMCLICYVIFPMFFIRSPGYLLLY